MLTAQDAVMEQSAPLELSVEELEQAQGGVAPVIIGVVKAAAAAGAGALVYKALDAIFG